jgi:hypothetical protein
VAWRPQQRGITARIGNVVADVDQAGRDDTGERCHDLLEADHGIVVLHVFLGDSDLSFVGCGCGDVIVDLLEGHAWRVLQVRIAFRRDGCEVVVRHRRVQLREACLVLRVEAWRIDFPEQLAFVDACAVVLVPFSHVAADLGIDRCLVPGHDVAGQGDGSLLRARLRRCQLHARDRRIVGLLLKVRQRDAARPDSVSRNNECHCEACDGKRPASTAVFRCTHPGLFCSCSGRLDRPLCMIANTQGTNTKVVTVAMVRPVPAVAPG